MKYVLGLTNAKELLETEVPSRHRKRELSDKSFHDSPPLLSRDDSRNVNKNDRTIVRTDVSPSIIYTKIEIPTVTEHTPLSPNGMMQPPSP